LGNLIKWACYYPKWFFFIQPYPNLLCHTNRDPDKNTIRDKNKGKGLSLSHPGLEAIFVFMVVYMFIIMAVSVRSVVGHAYQ
jgi:hypothetical protein